MFEQSRSSSIFARPGLRLAGRVVIALAGGGIFAALSWEAPSDDTKNLGEGSIRENKSVRVPVEPGLRVVRGITGPDTESKSALVAKRSKEDIAAAVSVDMPDDGAAPQLRHGGDAVTGEATTISEPRSRSPPQ